MGNDTKFGCTGCGLCCRYVGKAIENASLMPEPYASELKNFPYKAKKDGSCEMLNEDNKCSVYESRPLLCNIQEMFEKYKGQGPMPNDKKEYYLQEAKSCNSMIKQSGYPDNFIVNETQYEN